MQYLLAACAALAKVCFLGSHAGRSCRIYSRQLCGRLIAAQTSEGRLQYINVMLVPGDGRHFDIPALDLSFLVLDHIGRPVTTTIASALESTCKGVGS